MIIKKKRSDGIIQRYHVVGLRQNIPRPITNKIKVLSIKNYLTKGKEENFYLTLWEKIQHTKEYNGDDFYHSTFLDKLKNISKKGLLPDAHKFYNVSDQMIYLCQTPSGAGYWADLQNVMSINERISVLLRIKYDYFEKIDASLWPDYDEMGSRQSYSTCTKFSKTIPPEAIEVYLDRTEKFVRLTEIRGLK